MSFYSDLRRRLTALAQQNADVFLRDTVLAPGGIPLSVAAVEGLIDQEALRLHVLTPLARREDFDAGADTEAQLMRYGLTVGEIRQESDAEAAVSDLFHGAAVLICPAFPRALILRLNGGARRGPEEPVCDRTVSGPREGFVENLSVDLGLLRRRIADPGLVCEKHTLGRRSRTDVALCYLSDLALPETVEQVRAAICALDVDGIPASGWLGQLISGERTLFPTYREIERTDIAAAQLLEGRVLLLCDGSPLAISLPALLCEHMQAAEDYYEKPAAGNLARGLRWACFFLSVSLPALYVSLVSFRPEILPYDLLVSIASLRSRVPFSAVVEMLLMEFAVQIIVESSLRLPQPLGQTIGVVSGIIVGQAIISASLASPMVLIVVAVSNICTFAIPGYSLSLTTRVLRPLMILPAAVFGLFGFSLSWVALLLHLVGLESAGRPVMAPYAPFVPEDLQDAALRSPLSRMRLRPRSVGSRDPVRQGKRD